MVTLCFDRHVQVFQTSLNGNQNLKVKCDPAPPVSYQRFEATACWLLAQWNPHFYQNPSG